MTVQLPSMHRDFATQMENFKRETHFFALCVYADMTVQHLSGWSRSKHPNSSMHGHSRTFRRGRQGW